MPRQIKADGKIYVVPDDATDDEINSIVGQEPGFMDTIHALRDKAQGWLNQNTQPSDTTGMNWLQRNVGGTLEDAGNRIVRNVGTAALHPIDTVTQMGAMLPGVNMSDITHPKGSTAALDTLTKTIKGYGQDYEKGGFPLAAGDVLGDVGTAALTDRALKVPGEIKSAVSDAGGIGPYIRQNATDLLVPGQPADLLQRALKPGVNVPDFTSKVNNTLGDVIRAAPDRPRTVSEFGAAADRARDINQAGYQGLFQGNDEFGNPIGETPVSTNPLSEAVRGSISPTTQFENPLTGKASSLEPEADFYGTAVTNLGTLDDLRKTRNAELNTFYADSPADRASLRRANPDIAAKEAMRDAAANQVYGTLESKTGVPSDVIQDIQNSYGDLRDISDVANKRDTVYGRQNPISLQEQLTTGHGGPIDRLTNFVASKFLKNVTGSDALVDAATRRYMQSNPDLSGGGVPFTPIPFTPTPQPRVRGLLPSNVPANAEEPGAGPASYPENVGASYGPARPAAQLPAMSRSSMNDLLNDINQNESQIGQPGIYRYRGAYPPGSVFNEEPMSTHTGQAADVEPFSLREQMMSGQMNPRGPAKKGLMKSQANRAGGQGEADLTNQILNESGAFSGSGAGDVEPGSLRDQVADYNTTPRGPAKKGLMRKNSQVRNAGVDDTKESLIQTISGAGANNGADNVPIQNFGSDNQAGGWQDTSSGRGKSLKIPGQGTLYTDVEDAMDDLLGPKSSPKLSKPGVIDQQLDWLNKVQNDFKGEMTPEDIAFMNAMRKKTGGAMPTPEQSIEVWRSLRRKR